MGESGNQGHGELHGRDQAWELLTEWTASGSLRKHALAVEACVTACGQAEADQLGLEERSMGMSDDLEAAVAAGSTMVRIGRALFGDRSAATAGSGGT